MTVVVVVVWSEEVLETALAEAAAEAGVAPSRPAAAARAAVMVIRVTAALARGMALSFETVSRAAGLVKPGSGLGARGPVPAPAGEPN
ncbi:MAG TPA: hypothetical protein VGS19_26640 [Streptosporangiaceae bacterium]|nr:hypothetical protein [Streptosporangiaceae bacterium]